MADLKIPNLDVNQDKYIFKKKLSLRLKLNIKADSINNLFLDFLLKLNFFLKIYLSDLIFKFGMFKSAIHQSSNKKIKNYYEKKLR